MLRRSGEGGGGVGGRGGGGGAFKYMIVRED